MRRAQASTIPSITALAIVLLGCGAEVSPCAGLASDAAAHLAEFERFVALAERVAGADSAFQSRAQLEESLFSSLGRDPEVLAAWVERTGASAVRLTLPTVAPPLAADFSTCRLPNGARVEVARGVLHIGESPGPALFLRRQIDRPPQRLSVAIAFVTEPTADSH